MATKNQSGKKVQLHLGDLPAGVSFGKSVAVDTETMGLRPERDRLCLVQLSSGDGTAHLVQAEGLVWNAPNLKALLADTGVEKLFHFARFDVAFLYKYLGVMCTPVWCTKIASRLARTYTDKHGLQTLCRDLLDKPISKTQQTSDWGAETLTPKQQAYAANDVLFLHELQEKLKAQLEREGRLELAEECFAFLPTRARLDLLQFANPPLDIFDH